MIFRNQALLKKLKAVDVLNSSIFDESLNRKNTSSLKWDALQTIYGIEDLLPMWVADMDFPAPPFVQEALIERIKHPVFGYTIAPPSVYSHITDWVQTRHSWEITKDQITFSPGVVSSIGTAIQALTKPNDRILIQSPVYMPFFEMVKRNGREVVLNELQLVDNRYTIDFTDFEEKIKNDVKLFLLCSPHNPGGRVWTKAELQKMSELCLQYNVTIVSDEIHADLTHSSYQHVPTASLNPAVADNTITFMAPSKTFNLAGLQASYIITNNKKLQLAFKRVQEAQGFHGLNTFALTAMDAAYREGGQWLDELLAYIEANIQIAESFIANEIPTLSCMHPEASYLLWIDCRGLGLTNQQIQDALLQKGKLALEPGKKYGPGGEGFVRMNVGCPRSVLLDGLNRLKLAFTN